MKTESAFGFKRRKSAIEEEFPLLKIWAKLIRDNKLMGQAVVPIDESLPTEQMLKASLEEICRELDLANPIVQSKHIRDMEQYRLTRFLPESFIEDVPFDRMDLNIFEDKPKKHR